MGSSPTAANSLLGQCLVLALLLHIWLVLMFGNATGTARPGDGVWGRLNVTLAGSRGETGSAAAQPTPPMPELSRGPLGQAKQQRFGGTVRPMEDPSAKAYRPTTPGAAEVGTWQAQRVQAPVEAVTDSNDAKAGTPVGTAAATPATAAAEVQPSSPALMMAPSAQQHVVTRMKAAPMASLSAAPPLALQPLDPSPLPQTRVKVMEPAPAIGISRAQAAAIGSSSGAAKQPSLARPPSRLTPALIAASPPPSLPQFKPESLPRPLAVPVAAAAASVPAVPAAVPPVPVLETAAAPVPSPSPKSSIDPAAAVPPTPEPAAPVPAALPEIKAKQMAAPTELSRQVRSDVKLMTPAPPAQSAALAPLAATAASAVTVPSAVPAPAAIATATATIPAPGLVPALSSPGSPEAGPRLGQDVATPASTPAKPPPLNLTLPRPRGGELSSRGSSGVLQLLPAPPERKSKLSEDLEKAAKEDCRKAYGEAGLLAVVPLVLDAAKSNKGCRW